MNRISQAFQKHLIGMSIGYRYKCISVLTVKKLSVSIGIVIGQTKTVFVCNRQNNKESEVRMMIEMTIENVIRYDVKTSVCVL